MKIVGVSLGTRNGSNDAMCKEALIAAQEAGAEVSFIHLHDWEIQYCTGCVACSRGLVMGKGNICTRKDEFDELRSILLDADGVLVVDPIFEKGASALFHSLMDRFGPRMDRGMNVVATKIAEQDPNAKSVDPRLLKDKVISLLESAVPTGRLPLNTITVCWRFLRPGRSLITRNSPGRKILSWRTRR